MNLGPFWIYRDDVAASGYQGFSVFSLPHLLWLAFLAAGAATYIVSYLKGGEHRRSNMRKGTALFLILFEIMKICVLALTGAPNVDNLPLEVCSFAEYTILIDAMWPENRIFKPAMVFLFLPAALMALMFPTVTVYPPVNFYTIHQFVMHAVAAAYILARYVSGEARPGYRELWVGVLMLLVLIPPVYLIDRAFDNNFMFLTYHSNNVMLKKIWDLCGGNGGFLYLLGLTLFVIVVIHIVYGVFAVTQKAPWRKDRSQGDED